MLSTAALTPATTAGCNVVSRDLTRLVTYSQSFDSTSIRRRNSVLLRSPSSRRVSPVVAAVTGHQPNGLAVGVKEVEEEKEKSLADRLRLGSLTEDGLSYKERFIVRCYEVGVNKTATVETIANLLQEVGGNHAQSVGFSTDGFATTTTMRKLHLIWVTARMHIEIYRYPAWIGTRRDWILKDYANGEVIGRATSKWVMMNEDTRRLQKVSDDVRDEYLIFCPKTLRADLDMNKHVNNVTYIGWVLESIPQEIIDSHELQAITLDYRRECQHDDIVDSLTTPEPLNDSSNGSADGENLSKFLHLLRSSGDGLEINRGRTEWRKKPLKR
ncbi:Acyl-ACP thioesterase [Cynara cardunculus var. scolymus]|uniref:Acyl-[acyl-carrier-protein] hydrolase n=1 Tax=Cynara cardunculus var. scolymus TaxID=59895 RepID=A0A103YNF1_CYNCS|nr:Acyl-ACP thioesterase [Cynara cardunculus var. scolymus]